MLPGDRPVWANSLQERCFEVERGQLVISFHLRVVILVLKRPAQLRLRALSSRPCLCARPPPPQACGCRCPASTPGWGPGCAPRPRARTRCCGWLSPPLPPPSPAAASSKVTFSLNHCPRVSGGGPSSLREVRWGEAVPLPGDVLVCRGGTAPLPIIWGRASPLAPHSRLFASTFRNAVGPVRVQSVLGL